MSKELIAANPDLAKLIDEGYELQIKSNHLLIHNIPYLKADGKHARGTMVSTLCFSDSLTVGKPDIHTVMFIGEHPCDTEGNHITAIGEPSTSINKEIAADIIINRSFSAMPEEGMYADYFEKMDTYIKIISHPAIAKYSNLSPKTYGNPEFEDSHSPFKYPDISSTRANIKAISAKLELENIAIVGLGGTGSYILDLLSKTPVKQIHLFDGDRFLLHNAFRAPGAASQEEISQSLYKVNYFQSCYSQMHKGIIANPHHIANDNIGMLENMTFVFVCVDNGAAKKIIIKALVNFNIPFIDVGMGIDNINNKLAGSLRTTLSSPDMRNHISNYIEFSDTGEDAYSSNIQIADLNMLNASLAVIKWKKYYAFYHDIEEEFNSIYDVDGNCITNGEKNAKTVAA